MEQGSPDWFAARLGKVTASRICDVTARTKSGWGAPRANYAAQLIAERLTGTPAESFQSPAMKWGTECEPEAAAAYAFRFDAELETAGFIDHPTIAMAGASPDRLVAAEGLVEIKCPNTATHLDTLLTRAVPSQYVPQMQFQMACTGRQWCDFVSYDPRLPESMRLFVERVPRDQAFIDEVEAQVTTFLAEIDQRVALLRERYEQREAA